MRAGKSLSDRAQDDVTVITVAKPGKLPLPYLGFCLLMNTM